MKHLNELLTKLSNAQRMKGCFAMQEAAEATENHLDKACVEYDMFEGQAAYISELEAENAELRRRLRAQGISDKVA